MTTKLPPSSKLLLDEQPLIILPSLAVALGLNEAIFLQQLHYWLQIAKAGNGGSGKFHEERWWIYNSYKDWQRNFPFWSEGTIKRVIQVLTKLGIVDSHETPAPDVDGGSQKWYAINYERLEFLTGYDQLDHTSGLIKMIKGGGSKRSNPPDQNDHTPHIYNESETTTEITSETTESLEQRDSTPAKSLADTPGGDQQDDPLVSPDDDQPDQLPPPPTPVWDGQTTIVINITAIDGERPDYDVYIGRGNGRAGLKRSKWANPFKVGKDGSRDEVIAQYRAYLDEHPDLLRAIPELVGKRLGCWCAPESCHGDVLAALANAYARGEWQPPEKPVQPHIALIDAYWSALPGGRPIAEDYPRHVRLASQVHEAGYTPAQIAACTAALYNPESPLFDRFWLNKIITFEEVVRRLPIWAQTETPEADGNEPVDLTAPEWQGVELVVFRPETLDEKMARAQALRQAEAEGRIAEYLQERQREYEQRRQHH
jgi:hypothetical protein